MWNEQRDNQEDYYQQKISTMLTQRGLHFLGHIIRHLAEDRLPRKLAVCAPSRGKQSVGGQRMT